MPVTTASGKDSGATKEGDGSGAWLSPGPGDGAALAGGSDGDTAPPEVSFAS